MSVACVNRRSPFRAQPILEAAVSQSTFASLPN